MISFLFSMVESPVPAFAQGPLHNSLLTEKSSLSDESSLLKINVPEQWGEEVQNYQGQKGQTVIFIQDLHGNIQAQKNIVKLLQRLADAGINTLGVEGASGSVDIRAVRNIVQKSLREKIAGFFLKRGYFCGVEYLVSTDLKHSWKLYGLENKDLYIQNLHQYRNQIKDLEKTKDLIQRIEKKFAFLEENELNPDLKSFIRKLGKQNDDIEKTTKFLLKEAHKYGFTPGRQMRLKIRQESIEAKMNIKNVYSQRNQLIETLSKTLVKEEAMELVQQALSYRTGELTSYQFYSWLKNECRVKKISLEGYSDLDRYMRIVEIQEKSDETKLYSEIESLTSQLEKHLSIRFQENQLIEEEKKWTLLKNLYLGELSREELKSSADQKNQTDSLKHYFEENNIDVFEKNEWEYLIHKEKESQAFYETVLSRDTALLENIIGIMEHEKTNRLVVVSGGFHTEGVVRELEKRGISYRVILPHGNAEQNDDLYIEQILGNARAVNELVGRRGIRLNAALKLANPANLDGELSEQARDFYEALYALMLSLGVDWQDTVMDQDLQASAVLLKNKLETCFPAGLRASLEERDGVPGVSFQRDGAVVWKSLDAISGQLKTQSEHGREGVKNLADVIVSGKEAEALFKSSRISVKAQTVKELVLQLRKTAGEIPVSILINGKDAEFDMDIPQTISMNDRIEVISPDYMGSYSNGEMPFAIYSSKKLRVSHLTEPRTVWQNMVREHIELILLAQRISRNYPHDISKRDLSLLYNMVDFRSKSEYEIRYLLGFAAYNSEYIGVTVEYLLRYLSVIAACQRSGISPAEFSEGISAVIDWSFFKIDEIAEFRYPGKAYYHWNTSRDSLIQQIERLSGWDKAKRDDFLARMENLVTEVLPSTKLGLHNVVHETYGRESPAYLCVLPEYLTRVQDIISSMPIAEITAEDAIDPSADPRKERVFQRSMKSDAPVLTNEGDEKVRSFRLGDGTVLYLKRVNILRVRYPEEEIDIAERIDAHLKQKNLMTSAVRFVGTAYAKGSFYIISEAVSGDRLSERMMPEKGSPAFEALQDIVAELKQEGVWHADDMAREKDILVSDDGAGKVHYTVIDLETMPYASKKEQRPAADELTVSSLTKDYLAALTLTVSDSEKEAVLAGNSVSRQERLLGVWEHDLIQRLSSSHPFRKTLSELIEKSPEDAEILGNIVKDAPGLSEDERNFLVFAIEPGQGGGQHENIQELRRQIRKVVARLASGTPNNQEMTALIRLENPDVSAVQQAVRSLRLSLNADEAKKIIEVLTSFKTKKTEIRTAPKTGPPELSIPLADTSAETVNQLISEIKRAGNAILKNESVSLKPLLEIARRINPNLRSPVDESRLETSDIDALGICVSHLDMQVFRPLNQMCAVHIVSDYVEIYHARIDNSSWRKISYLGRDLWVADMDWFPDSQKSSGISTQNFAFVAANFTRPMAGVTYEGLPFVTVTDPLTYLDLRTRLNKSGINKDSYTELFAVERVRQEEIHHVKDHIFASLYFRKPLISVFPKDVVAAILKPPSESVLLRDSWDRTDISDAERWHLNLGIIELSGHLAGLIHEMEGLMRKGKSDLAYAAFLDFIGGQRVMKIMNVGVGYAVAYKKASELLDAELALEGIHNDVELMDYCENGTEKAGRRAYDLMRRIYARNFWTDSERERLLEERKPEKAGSISQGAKSFREFERRRDEGQYENAKDEKLTQKYRDLLHGDEIYVVDAIVMPKKQKTGPDDFFLGYHDKDNKRVYLTREVLKALERRDPGKSIDPRSLEREYVLHEANEDRSKGAKYHYQLIEDQQGEFPEHYEGRGYWEHGGKFYDATGQSLAALALFKLNSEHVIREKNLKLGKGALGDRLRLVIDALSGPFDSFNDAFAKYVQVYGSPNHEDLEAIQAVKERLPEEWVKAHGIKDFVEMARTSKGRRDELFMKLPAFKHEFTRKLKSFGSPAEFDFFWPGIKKLITASGDTAPQLLEHGLIRITEWFKQDTVLEWPDLVTLGEAAGERATYLFDNGMREIFPYWKKHRQSFLRMAKAGGHADELFVALGELKMVFRGLDFEQIIPNLADIAEDCRGQTLKLFQETFPRVEGRYGTEFTKRWRQFYVFTRLTGERAPQFLTETLPVLKSLFDIVSAGTAEQINILDVLTAIFKKSQNGNRVKAAMAVMDLVSALNEEKRWIEHHRDYVRQGLIDLSKLVQSADSEDKILAGLKVLIHDVRTENARIRRGEVQPNIYLGGMRKKISELGTTLTPGEKDILIKFARTAPYSPDRGDQIENTGIIYRVIEFDGNQTESEAIRILRRFGGACHVSGPHNVNYVFVDVGMALSDRQEAKEHELLEIFWERKLQMEVGRMKRQGGATIFELYGFDFQRAVHILASSHHILLRNWVTVSESTFLRRELAGMTDDELKKLIAEDRQAHHLLNSIYLFGFVASLGPGRLAQIQSFEESVKSEALRLMHDRALAAVETDSTIVELGTRKPVTESDVRLSAGEWDEVLAFAREAGGETKTSSGGAFTYQLVEYDPHTGMGPMLGKLGEACHFQDVLKGNTYVLLEKGLRDRAHAIEHEELEMKWQKNLIGKNTLGFTRRKAAHILAWAEQIDVRGWKNVQESGFLIKQLTGMTLPQLEKILGEQRQTQNSLIRQYIPEALESTQTFEASFRKSAKEQIYYKVWRYLQSGKSVKELLKYNSPAVLEVLKEIALMNVRMPGTIVEEVRAAIIPLLIKGMDLGLLEIGLSAQDLESISHSFDELFPADDESDITKLFFLEALRPTRAQKCIESENILRQLMQDINPAIRRKALEVFSAYLFDEHLHGQLVQSKENHALNIYYFPQPETIRLLLSLMNDADESVKLQASRIIQSLLYVDHYYVSNAIGLNSLTGLHDVPWQYYQEIFLPMLSVPHPDQIREPELVQMQRNIAFNLFHEMIDARDIQGRALLARQDVRPLLDRLIQFLAEPNPYFAQAFELYADIGVSHRLQKVMECLERNFSRTRSVLDRGRLIKNVGKITEWKALKPATRTLRILDIWLKQFLVPGLARPRENEEIHTLETKTGTIELRWKDALSPEVVEISGDFPRKLAVGDPLVIKNGLLASGMSVQAAVASFSRENQAYSVLFHVFYNDVKISFELETDQIAQIFEFMAGRPVSFQGVIKALSLEDYDKFVRDGKVNVTKPDLRLMQSAVSYFDALRDATAAAFLLQLLEDPNSGIRDAVYRRLDGEFFRAHPDYLDYFLTWLEQGWMNEDDPRILISDMLRVLSIGKALERRPGFDKVKASFYRMKENYVKREAQNLHVLHAIQYTELHLTRPPLARFVSLPVASAFHDQIPLLREWLKAVKEYFADYDTELDSTEDEKLSGLSNSNILKFNLRAVDLLSLMEVLRHETRHRVTKTARMPYAQNELLSRIEDVLSIKFAERMKKRETWDLDYALDAVMAHKKNELTTVLSSTYAASPMDAEMTDRYLSRILDIDAGQNDWHQKVNAVLDDLEKELGIFVPRITNEEVDYLDRDLTLRENIEIRSNAKVEKVLEMTRELVHQYFALHGGIFSARDREKMEKIAGRLIDVDFLRMHIHLEEDFAERIHEGLSDLDQKDERIVLENRLSNLHFSGQALWKRLQYLLRTQGTPSRVASHRISLIVKGFSTFSLKMFDAARSKRYFPEIAKEMLGQNLRGKSNLSNEIYSQVLQRQIFEKGLFRAVKYEDGVFKEADFISDDGAMIESRSAPLTDENMEFLNSLYLANPPEEGTIFLFVDGLDEEIQGTTSPDAVGAHYGVIRPQIYIDRTALQNPDKALLEINHELEERQAVIKGLSTYPNWREIYSDPGHSEYYRVKNRASELAQEAHFKLHLREKTLLADQHLQNILEEIVVRNTAAILKAKAHNIDKSIYLKTIKQFGVSILKRWFFLKASAGPDRMSYEDFVLGLDINSPQVMEIEKELRRVGISATGFFRNAERVRIPGVTLEDQTAGWANQMKDYFSKLIQEKIGRDDYNIRVQSIGASNGKEAYSIALILQTQLEAYRDQHGMGSDWIDRWDVNIECFENQIPLLFQAKTGFFTIDDDEMKHLEKYFPEYLEKMKISPYREHSFIVEMPDELKAWIKPVYTFYNYLDFSSVGRYHEYQTFEGHPTLVVLLNFLRYVTDINTDLLMSIYFHGTLDHSYSTGILMNEGLNTRGVLPIKPPNQDAFAFSKINIRDKKLIENLFRAVKGPEDLREMLIQNMTLLEGNWIADHSRIESADEAVKFLEQYGGSHAFGEFLRTYALNAFSRSEELNPDIEFHLRSMLRNAAERKRLMENILSQNQKLLEILLKDKNVIVIDAAMDEKDIQELAAKIDQKTSYILIAEHGDTSLPEDFRQRMQGIFKNTRKLQFIQIPDGIAKEEFISKIRTALSELTGTPFESEKDKIISVYQNVHALLYQALAGELAIDILSANGRVPFAVEDRLKTLGITGDDQSESLKLLEEVQILQERREQVHAIYRRTLRAK